MRLIDADKISESKFHPLPYTHITPTDVDAESYKRGWNDAIDAIIIEEPTAEEPHWIPCSERLPEYGVSVLTYDGHCFCVEKRIPTIRDNEGEPIIGDWWVSDDYDEHDSDYYPNLRDGACIAWMPLPEPWRGDAE